MGVWLYFIYLWYWFIVVVIYKNELSEVYVVLGFFLLIVLGYLSYWFIEIIKFSKKESIFKLVFINKFLIFVVLVVLIGSFLNYIDGFIDCYLVVY